MKITIGSLFDGISGFPLAGQRNGMTALWASEIEPFPIKVSTIRFPDMKRMGDITKIDCSKLEPVDIITGGSPCQDLSVAGKRAGLAGARSGLFMEQIRIVRELREIDKRSGRTGINIRPRFMLWENVPGAFSSNKGEDFRAVLEETARIADETVVIPGPAKGKWNTCGTIMGNGYSIAWRILDAQYWGVPQRRRRIFLVADFGGQSAPEILFKRKGLSRNSQESGEARERVTADAERGIRKASGFCTEHSAASRGIGYQEECSPTLRAGVTPAIAIENHPADSRVKIDESGTCQTLTGRMGTGGGNVPMLAVVQDIGYRMTAFGEYVDDNSASTVKSRDYKDATDLVCSVDCRNLYENDEKSGTLQSKPNGGQSLNYQNPVRAGYSVRRLTPLECDRLQDYPDNWTLIPGASDSARYKADGNSIAVVCAEYVLEGIKEVLEVTNEK